MTESEAEASCITHNYLRTSVAHKNCGDIKKDRYIPKTFEKLTCGLSAQQSLEGFYCNKNGIQTYVYYLNAECECTLTSGNTSCYGETYPTNFTTIKARSCFELD